MQKNKRHSKQAPPKGFESSGYHPKALVISMTLLIVAVGGAYLYDEFYGVNIITGKPTGEVASKDQASPQSDDDAGLSFVTTPSAPKLNGSDVRNAFADLQQGAEYCLGSQDRIMAVGRAHGDAVDQIMERARAAPAGNSGAVLLPQESMQQRFNSEMNSLRAEMRRSCPTASGAASQAALRFASGSDPFAKLSPVLANCAVAFRQLGESTIMDGPDLLADMEKTTRLREEGERGARDCLPAFQATASNMGVELAASVLR